MLGAEDAHGAEMVQFWYDFGMVLVWFWCSFGVVDEGKVKGAPKGRMGPKRTSDGVVSTGVSGEWEAQSRRLERGPGSGDAFWRREGQSVHGFYFQCSDGGGTSVVQGMKIFWGQFKVNGGQKRLRRGFRTRSAVSRARARWSFSPFHRTRGVIPPPA